MTKINNQIKEVKFRFPGETFTGFGRRLSCAVQPNGAIWTAAQKETELGTTIVVVRELAGKKEYIELPVGPLYYQPALTPAGDDSFYLIWNEFAGGMWTVKCMEIMAAAFLITTPETVFSSGALCMPPVGLYYNERLYAAFPAIIDDRMRIISAVKANGQWTVSVPVSDETVDAFRPCLCAARDDIFIVWDQYADGRYEIAGGILNAAGCQPLPPVGSGLERWFCSDVAAGAGEVCVSWVAMREVADDLGIADHHPVIMTGKVVNGRIEVEPEPLADLREGLLPAKISKGYLGLRRNPQLSVDSADRIWCCWEVRMEEESTAVSGYLAGRCFAGSGWSDAAILSGAGYGYAVPDKQVVPELKFSFFRFGVTGMDILASGTVDPAEKQPYTVDETRWSRWHAFDIKPLEKPARKIDVAGEKYAMFWADTHCHSNISADAEGELDEIIHYARDIAGLDAVCVMDNDFYPNKMLSLAEWQARQEFCRHYTKAGKFILFPGYEFTYHRKDLDPDFNHRCVVYPRPGQTAPAD